MTTNKDTITMKFSTLDKLLELAIIEGRNNPERDTHLIMMLVKDDISRITKGVNDDKS
jgi:hypothetical protein